ncbi:MAG: sugar transporter [Haliea sp.]|nr:sugar transporter [Haliea sp.]
MNATGNRLSRLFYASGVVNYALKDAAFGAFVLFYYKQVLGLSGTLTGLAIALSILFDAVTDPLVGAWSDRLRGPWGRRHPLMLASVLPLALCFIAMFSPPDGVLHSQALLFSWLLGSVIALRTALTFFMVPYLALGAELSDDYHERTRLAGVRTNLGWFVGVLVPSTSLILIFQESQGTDGRFIVDNYHSYGLLSAVGVALFSAICIRGTWGYISQLGSPKEPVDSNLVRDILTTFRNANFRFLVILDTAIGGVAGIIGALLMVTYTYFWQLDTAEISLLFAGPPLIAVLLVTSSASAVNRLLEKQQLLRLSCIVTAVNAAWLTPLKLWGALPEADNLVFVLVFLNYAIHVTFVILRTVSNHALLADVADEQALASGQRQEGVMFAAAFFAAKFVSGFGYLVAGPYLDLIGLESHMLPGEAPESTIWGLGLMMGPGIALLMLIPVWMSYRLDLSLARHKQVREALADQRAGA